MEQKAACHMRSVCHWRGHGTGFRKYEKKSVQTDQNTPNPQARRPRADHGQRVAARDVTSEFEEDEEERVEWGTCK